MAQAGAGGGLAQSRTERGCGFRDLRFAEASRTMLAVRRNPPQWARVAGMAIWPGAMVWMSTEIVEDTMSQPIVYVDTSEVRPGRLGRVSL